MLTLHASCVALAGEAVLLRGPSGAGKSDLALRLIEDGAQLVADDQTRLRRDGAILQATAPERLYGLLEIRGLGPVDIRTMNLMPAETARLRVIFDLLPRPEVPRLPEPRFETLLGVTLPCLALDAFSTSASVVVRWALRLAIAGRLFEPAEVHDIRQPLSRGA